MKSVLFTILALETCTISEIMYKIIEGHRDKGFDIAHTITIPSGRPYVYLSRFLGYRELLSKNRTCVRCPR